MNDVAVIVGGAHGIGHATAQTLAAEGWSICLADIDQDRAQVALATLPGEGHESVVVDVTDSVSVRALFDDLAQRSVPVSAVVITAGVARPHPTSDLSDEAWHALLDINLHGSFYCARAAYPLLVRRERSAIVFISSVAAHIGLGRRLSYSASKGALEAMARALAIEWVDQGIRVNAVAPGYTRTPLVAKAFGDGLADESAITKEIPFGRLANPEEIADGIAFLVGPRATYITGQTLIIDGGLSIRTSW